MARVTARLGYATLAPRPRWARPDGLRWRAARPRLGRTLRSTREQQLEAAALTGHNTLPARARMVAQ